MLSPTPARRKRRQVTIRILLATALLLTSSLAFATTPAVADAKELLPNADFTQAGSGWRTNRASQVLTVRDGIAHLSTSIAGTTVLNDSPNAVQNTTKGTQYVASARVRTTTPNLSGAIRIREVSGSKVNTSSTTFELTSTSWQVVTLNVTTIHPGSQLDFNVLARHLPVGSNLQVDWVSLKVSAPPTQAPPAPPAAPPAQCSVAPPKGTIFGSTVSTSNQSLAESISNIDSTFGRVGVIRHFSDGLPFDWSSGAAQQLKGRTLVLSFKVSPTAITAGKHDAFFRKWFSSAPSNQTIYWSYYHEPENNINAGEFTAAQYRAAWTRLANLEKEACRQNLHATLILTEWTMQPGSKRDYKSYDAGPDYVKVLAFDPYNGASDPKRDYYKSAQDLLGPIATKMKADGRPWGIAELGSRIIPSDKTGDGRVAWLSSVAQYAEKNGALFATYFHSRGWVLHDQKSAQTWAALVKK